MQNILQESQIFGPIDIYSYYPAAIEVKLEASENYQKKSYRNRYNILGANGTIELSIPLIKGKNQKTNIKKVEIAYYEPWYSNHIHSIKSAYGNAPYFIHYSDYIFDLLKSKERFLYQLNQKALLMILKFLKIDVVITETEEFTKAPSGYRDMRNVFNKNNSSELKDRIPYLQVFEDKFGFVSGLSILDLLFNLGPESKMYLEKSDQSAK